MGQGVEQGRFPRIGIADDGENGKRLTETSRPALILMAGDIIDFPLQMGNAVADAAAIGFELGLTRSARADPASEA